MEYNPFGISSGWDRVTSTPGTSNFKLMAFRQTDNGPLEIPGSAMVTICMVKASFYGIFVESLRTI